MRVNANADEEVGISDLEPTHILCVSCYECSRLWLGAACALSLSLESLWLASHLPISGLPCPATQIMVLCVSDQTR